MAAKLPCSLTPSTVVISCPSQLAASMVHESIGVPSTSTVDEPHEESSQPRFEPVRFRSRRSTSSKSAFGSMASSCVRPLMRSSASSFFMMNSFELRAACFEQALVARSSRLVARNSVQRHLRIHRARPSIDATAHGLRFLESLLTEPVGNAERPHSLMTHDDNVVVRIEFLMCPRRDVAHRDMFRAFEARSFQLPRLAHIQPGARPAPLLQRFDLAGTDF